MKNKLNALAIGAGIAFILGAAVARADDGPWEVRLRADYLMPADVSGSFEPLGIPGDAIHVADKWLPDLDVEYYFTKNWSSELVLTYPQVMHVTVEQSVLNAPLQLGSFRALPPTLTAKYNFNPDGTFRPYAGVGVNFTLISDVNLNVPGVGPLTLKNYSLGPAAQAGFDLKLKDHWYLNLDVKYMLMQSDVKYGGLTVTHVQIDPFLFGLGVGYRFGGK